MAGKHRTSQPVRASAQRRGTHRRPSERQAFKWLGAGVLSLGVSVAMANGTGVAHADSDHPSESSTAAPSQSAADDSAAENSSAEANSPSSPATSQDERTNFRPLQKHRSPAEGLARHAKDSEYGRDESDTDSLGTPDESEPNSEENSRATTDPNPSDDAPLSGSSPLRTRAAADLEIDGAAPLPVQPSITTLHKEPQIDAVLAAQEEPQLNASGQSAQSGQTTPETTLTVFTDITLPDTPRVPVTDEMSAIDSPTNPSAENAGLVLAAAFRRIAEDANNSDADLTTGLNTGQTFESTKASATTTTNGLTWTPALPPGSAPVFDALLAPLLNQIANLIPRAIADITNAINGAITTAVQNVSFFLTSIAQGLSYVRANVEVIYKYLTGPFLPWTVFRGPDGYYYVGMGI
jgi:hypothetical protein